MFGTKYDLKRKECVTVNLDLEPVFDKDILGFSYLLDIDNTLLDLLSGVEREVKGYSASLQDNYSFLTKRISKVCDPKAIYELFKPKKDMPNFFSTLDLTDLAEKNKYILEDDRINKVVFTNEHYLDNFKAKVSRLVELIPNMKNVHFYRYTESKVREYFLVKAKENKATVADDHPNTIRIAGELGLSLMTTNDIYVQNAVLKEFKDPNSDFALVAMYDRCCKGSE